MGTKGARRPVWRVLDLNLLFSLAFVRLSTFPSVAAGRLVQPAFRRKVTHIEVVKRASALVLQTGSTARDARMTMGGDGLVEPDAVGKAPQVLIPSTKR